MFVCAQHMQLDLKQSKYLHNTLHKQGLLLKRATLPQHTILLQTSQRTCAVFLQQVSFPRCQSYAHHYWQDLE